MVKDQTFYENSNNEDCSKFKSVKRRYKEFVDLQSKMEENPLLKPLLKNIKAPSKFLNLPIGNMENEIIERRRKKLNEYLNVSIA